MAIVIVVTEMHLVSWHSWQSADIARNRLGLEIKANFACPRVTTNGHVSVVFPQTIVSLYFATSDLPYISTARGYECHGYDVERADASCSTRKGSSICSKRFESSSFKFAVEDLTQDGNQKRE